MLVYILVELYHSSYLLFIDNNGSLNVVLNHQRQSRYDTSQCSHGSIPYNKPNMGIESLEHCLKNTAGKRVMMIANMTVPGCKKEMSWKTRTWKTVLGFPGDLLVCWVDFGGKKG